mgnify:FL=1
MDVKERFLKYVTYHTTSDEDSETVPSTARQRVLGQALAEELAALGLRNAGLDEFGYVYGVLPASPGCENLPALGFIAHMDTAPGVSGENVKPRCLRYEGGDIELGNGEALRVKDFPNLAKYVGQELIVTDGSTLLGADDKAGVAEIVSACACLLAHPEEKHRQIAVCFTPDEEIGRGPDHFDFAKFPAKQAYTVDGGEIGELEYENFNAAAAKVRIHGVNIHPGEAKNKMRNAALLAAEFVSLLPAAEAPAHTEGYEGFYHVTGLSGDESAAQVSLIIRDHDREKFEGRKRFLRELTDYLNLRHGAGTFTLELKDSYYNMKEMILPHMELIHRAEDAMRVCGVEPRIVPIRGGTDGARLSYQGLPCPNLCTGGANFHGIHEFVSADAMEKMVKVLVELSK